MISKLAAAFGVLSWFSVGLAVSAERPADVSILPLPASMTIAGGSFTVNAQTRIVYEGDERVGAVARHLGELLALSRGLRLTAAQGSVQSASTNVVTFALQRTARSALESVEAYTVDVSSNAARVTAADPRGLFYGAVTLWQLLTSASTDSTEIRIPALRIVDAPRLQWRGLLLDSSRQFQSVTFIKRFIDLMALHKLNVLHWQLADDAAWRLQIPQYPKLADSAGSYSAEDVRNIVQHAASRNVAIVPGLEMPGHVTAAVAAYPSLGAADRPGPGNLYNLEEETFAFFDAVLRHVAALFPGPFVHVGAGETSLEAWQQSEPVQARMRELGLVDDRWLYRYFFERIAALAQAHERRLVGWDNLLRGGVPASAVIMTARGLDGALGAAASGHEVVVSSGTALNFRLPQRAIASEGASSTEFLSLADVYNFDPAPLALSSQDRARLIGVQANVWTRSDGDEAGLEALTFPRAAALAEVAWTPPSQLSWGDFQPRLATMLGRYSRLGVRYSDAAFRVVAYQRGETTERVDVELTKQIPLGEIRYTLNGTEPNARSTVYTDLMSLARTAIIKAAVFHDGEPLSRTSVINVASDVVARQ